MGRTGRHNAVTDAHVDRAPSLVGTSAADTISRAIVHAILSAESVDTYPCHRDKYPEAYRS